MFVGFIYLSFIGCAHNTVIISSLAFSKSHDLNEFCKRDHSSYFLPVYPVGIFYCDRGVLNDWHELPAVQFSDGTIMHFNSGKLHRRYGPAIIWEDGKLEYYSNGKKHRENGPAVVWPDGYADYYGGTQEYWINGVQYTEKEYFNIF